MQVINEHRDYKYYVVIRLVSGKTEVAADLFLYVKNKFENKYIIINSNYYFMIINKVIYLTLEASLTILKKPF